MKTLPRALAPLANVNPFDILDKYEDGLEIRLIAERLGVSNVAIYKHLIKRCPDEWISTQAARALDDYETAKQELDDLDGKTCTSQSVTLAVARVKHYEWLLERTLRRLYGQSLQVDVAQTVDVRIAVNEAKRRAGLVIDNGESASAAPAIENKG